jgi:hypothetical protein
MGREYAVSSNWEANITHIIPALGKFAVATGRCDQVGQCLLGEPRQKRPSDMSEEPKGWSRSHRKRNIETS